MGRRAGQSVKLTEPRSRREEVTLRHAQGDTAIHRDLFQYHGRQNRAGDATEADARFSRLLAIAA
jgi:hypothetical protein